MALAPLLAAAVYGVRYRGGRVGTPDWSLGWGGNLASLLGLAHPLAPALLDRFGVVHADQGKGNFSCHAAHLVASTGADPYLAVCAATAALAGPMHAGASHDTLELYDGIRAHCGARPSYRQVEAFMVRWARSGRRLPGHGQAVMRNVDTRFLELYAFGERHFADSSAFAMVGQVWRAMPSAFGALGRPVNSPYPNVNLVSGTLLGQVGITEREFVPVLFATSRLIGILAQFVEDRIWAVAPERPDSLTTADLRSRVDDLADALV
jgi:citrate synthase